MIIIEHLILETPKRDYSKTKALHYCYMYCISNAIKIMTSLRRAAYFGGPPTIIILLKRLLHLLVPRVLITLQT